ncbi:MAG: hypothetical protein IJG23_00540 [Clostridia bacterium]|nr:hypothetical protein [Clostridia bacterium]
MAYYDNSAYDFETFAPKRKVASEPETRGFEPKIVRAPKKSFKQQREEKTKYTYKFLRVMAVSLVLFVLLGSRIYLQVSLTEKTRELDNYNAQIKVAQSENVALNNKLYEIMSLDTVEKKAVKELHMVKRDSSQIRYVAVDSTDNLTDGVRVDE